MSSEVIDADSDDSDRDGPEVGVRAGLSVPAPVGRVWEHLISAAGTKALLGNGARIGNKGEPWHADDGSYGVVRSYHPLEQVRLTWHPHEGGPLSMLDVQLRPEGEGTRMEVFHEGRGIADDPRADVDHWHQALERFTADLSS